MKINRCFFNLVILIILLLSLDVDATGGALRKNTIKTCPDGITYGLHGSKSSGTHWHRALTNGDGYYPDGAALSSDPCPSSNANKGTAGSTSKSSSSSNASSNKKSSGSSASKKASTGGSSTSSKKSSVTSNGSNSKTDSNLSQDSSDVVELSKSSDVSIKSISINGKSVLVSDEIEYETFDKKIDVIVVPSDEKSKVNILNNDKLKLGSNIVLINVVAEDGTKKDYKINVDRKECVIDKFYINSNEIKFDNNKAVYSILKGESSFDYSYELSDNNAIVSVFHNGKKIDDSGNVSSISDGDILKFIISDGDYENVYEVEIEQSSLLFTIIVYFLAIVLFLSPAIIVIIVIRCIKKRKVIRG